MKEIAAFYRVLGDESRLQMLWLLFHNRELCVCDFMAALGIPQSKASRHLACLRHAGLVVDRKEAVWSYHSLSPVKDVLARAQLEALRARLAEHPGAARLLSTLEKWLRRKGHDQACVGKKPARSKRRGRTR